MSLLRCNRPTRGGGVLLYYRKDLDCEQIHPPVSTPDTLWCRLRLSKHDDCLIGVTYRPPSATESANMTLLNTIVHILAKGFTHVLLMGDFNCPNLGKPITSHPFFEQQFIKLIASPLYNHVKEHTRFGNLQPPSILDLVLTNEELMIESVAVTTPLGHSDHEGLLFKNSFYASVKAVSPKDVRTFIDYAKLESLAPSIQWISHREQHNPLSVWQEFTGSL
ncbi:unnamed protein product [Echinostoma caproni]|uniref:Endo/exonuclease/phosphatase domain-containing protein n=1 Tax=Echinostoma caproni TaxID=27848 RepID=A0A183A4W6_9TREM|nr:unnamed protein product [Echinostoma caproni]